MKKIVVVGLGNIGKSISLTLAQSNCNVVAVTRRGSKGFTDFCNFVENAVKGNKTRKSKDEILSRVSWVVNFAEVPRDPELVIEAIKEDLNEKQRLFAKIDHIFLPKVVLSSSTSSLSITQISRLMVRSDRMVGLHFFNPAHIMNLVEVIPGEKTSETTTEKAKTFVDEIGKTPIVVPDQPGFLVNRLLFPMINEAISVLAEEKILAEDIDKAMKLGANHPMGPLRLADLVGLDVCLTIFENLYEKTKSPQYKPHPLLIQKVKDNNLGRKSQRHAKLTTVKG
jgi:3-hydroxybutyryl-CoA dehydrogenase